MIPFAAFIYWEPYARVIEYVNELLALKDATV